LLSTLAIVCIAILIPFTALGQIFGFVEMPLLFFAILALLIIAYIIIVEIVKNWFYKRYSPAAR
jgi:Mg2+-importing ATPase